jgi:type IV pilus assembly protein PilP
MNGLVALRNGLILCIAVAGITACSSDNDDLDRYINEIKAKPGGFIEPLPEITPYEIFTYVADAERIRSPFIPDTPQVNAAGTGRGPRPDVDRSPEFLEGFPLDT